MTAGQLATLLNSNNYVLSADNNITVTTNANVTWGSISTLTMNAGHDIAINASITASSGGLILNAANARLPRSTASKPKAERHSSRALSRNGQPRDLASRSWRDCYL